MKIVKKPLSYNGRESLDNVGTCFEFIRTIHLLGVNSE